MTQFFMSLSKNTYRQAPLLWSNAEIKVNIMFQGAILTWFGKVSSFIRVKEFSRIKNLIQTERKFPTYWQSFAFAILASLPNIQSEKYKHQWRKVPLKNFRMIFWKLDVSNFSKLYHKTDFIRQLHVISTFFWCMDYCCQSIIF